MSMNTKYISVFMFLLFTACKQNNPQFDASGNFEADEVIVSSEINGKILSLGIDEGATLAKDSIVGRIDSVNVSLQKEQVEASIQSLKDKTLNVIPQIKLLQDQLAVLQSQLNNL